MQKILLLLLFLTLIFVRSSSSRLTVQASKDRVLALPGLALNKLPFNHYAGYVTVNESAGRALFYWFTEAAHDPSSKPLVLWLNGGPGCSSVGYGALQELGPFRLHKSGIVRLNHFSWNKVANILFLESPAGVGFSYSNTTSDLDAPGDRRTALDAYLFLEHWLDRFPAYKHRDFYITGESYAGHYVPQLAKVIFDKSKRQKHHTINLKGYMVGNALLDHQQDRIGRVDYWWTHALISYHTYQSILRFCNLNGKKNGTLKECSNIISYALEHEFGSVDPYNIYAPICLNNSSSVISRRSYMRDPLWRTTEFYGYDPCGDDYVENYLNRHDVQQALHANVTGIPYRWHACSSTIGHNWQDSDETMLPIYRELIKADMRIWVYSGDVDSVVPVTSSRYSIEKLNLTIKTPWYPWYRDKQVGGHTEVYNGLTMVTIRGAGHEVPMFQPARALSLIESFLAGKPMPGQA